MLLNSMHSLSEKSHSLQESPRDAELNRFHCIIQNIKPIAHPLKFLDDLGQNFQGGSLSVGIMHQNDRFLFSLDPLNHIGIDPLRGDIVPRGVLRIHVPIVIGVATALHFLNNPLGSLLIKAVDAAPCKTEDCGLHTCNRIDVIPFFFEIL